MKKVLLIESPFYRLMGSHYNGVNLGVAYIAAVLKGQGHEVKVYNADYQPTTEYANQTQLLQNTPLYKVMLEDLSKPIWTEIKEYICSFAPDFVGISMLTANYKAAKNIAKMTKSISRDIKVVVGGAHATLDYQGTIAELDFDYVIRREGEFALLELVEGRQEEEIQGLSFKKANQIIHNQDRPFIQDLDTLPFPCRDSFVNDTKFLNLGYLITGRGCTFTCAYCASPRLWERKVHFRSISNVIEEIVFLYGKLGIRSLHFVDDTFTMNESRTKKICQEIINRRLDIQWTCDTRADCLDRELIKLMKQAGCVRVKIGVESGSDRVLKNIGKKITRERILRTVALIKEQELPLTVYLMAGFPGETDEDLRETIEFARELGADYYSLSVLAPYYGTRIWNDLEKSGKKMNKVHWEYFYHQSQEMLVNDGLNQELIKEFFELDKLGKGGRI